MAITPALFTRPAFTPAVSIVTGGASGIGRALIVRLAERGGQVVIADRDAAAASLASGPVLEQCSDMRNAPHRAGEPADEGRFLLHSWLEDVRKSSSALRSLISRAGKGTETSSASASEPSITDHRGPVVRSVGKPRNTVTPEAVDLMRELYESGLPLSKVCAQAGASRATVTRHLRKAGVRLRNQGLDDAELKIATDRYRAGDTLSQIGTALGVSPTTVGTYLRDSGTELRPSRAVAGVPHLLAS